MRLLTNKDSDSTSYFDKIVESEAGTEASSLSRIPIDDHEEIATRGRIKDRLPLTHFISF